MNYSEKSSGMSGVLYSMNSDDMTEPQPKYHESFIAYSFTKCCDKRKSFCTKHLIEMLRVCHNVQVIHFSLRTKNETFR